jgi:hypothetical protein
LEFHELNHLFQVLQHSLLQQLACRLPSRRTQT